MKRRALTRPQLNALHEATPPENIATRRRHSFEGACCTCGRTTSPCINGRAAPNPANTPPGAVAVAHHGELTLIPADYYGTEPWTAATRPDLGADPSGSVATDMALRGMRLLLAAALIQLKAVARRA
jgi:hypothetical protein